MPVTNFFLSLGCKTKPFVVIAVVVVFAVIIFKNRCLD